MAKQFAHENNIKKNIYSLWPQYARGYFYWNESAVWKHSTVQEHETFHTFYSLLTPNRYDDVFVSNLQILNKLTSTT